MRDPRAAFMTVGALFAQPRSEEDLPRMWLGREKNCELCGTEFNGVFIDGAMKPGPWALMCTACHDVHGVGLGLGKGQRYDAETRLLLFKEDME